MPMLTGVHPVEFRAFASFMWLACGAASAAGWIPASAERLHHTWTCKHRSENVLLLPGAWRAWAALRLQSCKITRYTAGCWLLGLLSLKLA